MSLKLLATWSTGASREYPSPLKFVDQAVQQNPRIWLNIEKPFWWDVPAWIASGRMDSVGLANSSIARPTDSYPARSFNKVFQHAKQLDLKLDLSLISNDAVRKIEIVRDGKVVKIISLADPHRAQKTANLSFQKSGWFLARAITTVSHTFRFASTGPFTIGRKSVSWPIWNENEISD